MSVRRRSAFTLIELLVVIAIITILAAILSPVLARAREKGRETACLNNLKQAGTAFQLYMDDWDEILPVMGHAPWSWVDRIAAYHHAKAIHICPSDDGIGEGGRAFSYVTSCESGGCRDRIPLSRSDFTAPSETILLAEANGILDWDHYHPARGYEWVRRELLPHRHAGRGNWTFVDGHVRSLTLDQTWIPVNLHLLARAERQDFTY